MKHCSHCSIVEVTFGLYCDECIEMIVSYLYDMDRQYWAAIQQKQEEIDYSNQLSLF